jgi:hypothetical protein
MKNNCFVPIFAAIVSPLFLETVPAHAFNLIVQSPVNYNKIEYTSWGENKRQVWIDPIKTISPPSKKLLALFKAQFADYDFEASYTPVYLDNLSL